MFRICCANADSSVRPLLFARAEADAYVSVDRIEEHVQLGNFTVADDDEVGARIGRCLAGYARRPPHAAGGTLHLFGRAELSVAERRVRCPDLAGISVDRVVPAIDAIRRVEGAVLGP